jgi:LysM repeat protein
MNTLQKTCRVLIASAVAVVGVVASISPVASAHSVASRGAQTQCAVSYSVVRGDSWWAISQKAGKSVSAVLKANKAKTSTMLLVGKKVCLPAGSKVGNGVSPTRGAPTCGVTYKAVHNDSWSRIATKRKVSLKELLKVNSATTKSNIFVGDVLCLPTSAKASPPSSGRLVLGPPPKIYSARKSTAIIREIFPERLHSRALAIAHRESRLNAAVYNWCCVGLFQLNWYAHNKWLGQMGVTAPEQLLDARVNAEAAYALYKRANGWGPWR